MGPKDHETTFVDSSLGIRNVDKSGMVDLSVLPFLVSISPVTTACLIGDMAVKMIGKLFKTCQKW